MVDCRDPSGGRTGAALFSTGGDARCGLTAGEAATVLNRFFGSALDTPGRVEVDVGRAAREVADAARRGPAGAVVRLEVVAGFDGLIGVARVDMVDGAMLDLLSAIVAPDDDFVAGRLETEDASDIRLAVPATVGFLLSASDFPRSSAELIEGRDLCVAVEVEPLVGGRRGAALLTDGRAGGLFNVLPAVDVRVAVDAVGRVADEVVLVVGRREAVVVGFVAEPVLEAVVEVVFVGVGRVAGDVSAGALVSGVSMIAKFLMVWV